MNRQANSGASALEIDSFTAGMVTIVEDRCQVLIYETHDRCSKREFDVLRFFPGIREKLSACAAYIETQKGIGSRSRDAL